MTGLRSPAACYHEAVVCSSVALYPDHVGGPGMKASRMDDYMQMSRTLLFTCMGNPGRLLYTRGLLLAGCSGGGDSEGGNSGRSE